MATNFGPHFERLDAVARSVSGSLVAVGGHRGEGIDGSKVHVFRAQKLAARFSIGVDAPVRAVVFLAGDALVIATADRLIVGDVSGDEPKSSFTVDATGVTTLATDVLGQKLFVAHEDGTVAAYAFDGKLTNMARGNWGHGLRTIAFDDATETIAAGGDEGVIYAARADGLETPRKMPCGEGGVHALAFTGDGRVAAGCGDGSIRLCFLDGAIDEENRSGDHAHEGAITGLVCLPAGQRRIQAVGVDGTLTSWVIDGRRKPRRTPLASGGSAITGAAWIPPSSKAKEDRAGGRLVIVERDRGIKVLGLTADGVPSSDLVVAASQFERLEADLGARGVKVRLAAVETLTAVDEDEARLLLDRGLSDGDPSVRIAASKAIAAKKRRRSRPALRHALEDDKAEVRRAAFDALSTIEHDRPLAAVRAALESGHADLRVEALSRLPALRKSSPLVPGLIAGALNDQTREVRRAALDALEALEGSDSLAWAHTALERGPADVRTATLGRLAQRPLPLTSETARMIDGALDDDDQNVRQVAFFVALAVRPRVASALALVDATTKKQLEKIPRPRSPSDGPLGPEDIAPLFAAMACPSPDTAIRGARALAALGDVRSVGALLQLSRETDNAIRRQAVDALLVLALALPTDERANARLSWLLDDPDDNISTAAYDALLILAEPNGVAGKLAHATTAMGAKRPEVRRRALQIVVEHPKDEHANDLLGRALDDESDGVRSEALRTLLLWNAKKPQVALRRAAASRHADVRAKVVSALTKIADDWAKSLLLSLVADASVEVGRAALTALVKDDPTRTDVFLMAMHSPRPEVRAEGCKRCHRAEAADLRPRLLELIQEPIVVVHLAAIEAADALMPNDPEPFRRAFASIFLELRVRAGELLGRRRQRAAVEPMKTLLKIPEFVFERPSDPLRQRAARAIADVGDGASIPFYVSLLDDADGLVREMGGRGLATACRPGREKPLVDALAHADLAVRSWAAEGLARIGDDRAIGVLAGTLTHEHRPIRIGAILGHVALGPDGVRGLLAGLEDADREIQELTFAIVLARDIALARAKVAPDLLLSALSSTQPEIRFAAARSVEERDTDLSEVARRLVGPIRPDRAQDMKRWPKDDEQKRLLDVLVAGLASDHPEQRYAAARVLELRPQPEAYWREARRLAQPGGGTKPHTNFDDEPREPRKKAWVRSLFGRPALPASESRTERVLTVIKYAGGKRPRAVPPEAATGPGDDLAAIVFGTYAGLVRQTTPAPGEADETHRVRRDSLDRLAHLAQHPAIGVLASLPVFMRALSDPHHLVRRQAAAALTSVYPAGSLEPVMRQLESNAADVGRAAVDIVIERAMDGDANAREMVVATLDAKNREVRAYALSRLPRVFDQGSVEPWLIALECPFADVRLAVVDRLTALSGEMDEGRVDVALARALESDHEDLRMKAATKLADRGDIRTVDVLASFLRAEDGRSARRATNALVTLGTFAPYDPKRAAAAAEAIVQRLDDDADQTADHTALVQALGRIRSPSAADYLLGRLDDDEPAHRQQAWSALVEIAKDPDRMPQKLPDGVRRMRYLEERALAYAEAAALVTDSILRLAAASLLRDIDDAHSEKLLARLTEDRDADVRVAATESLAFRAVHVDGASLAPLQAVLRTERRELVLPAALGMAGRNETSAFRPLMLVFKAGSAEERERAILGLGTLGDSRALDDLLTIVDPSAEVDEETVAFVPAVAESLGALLGRLTGEPQAKVRETVERLAVEGETNVRLRALVGLRRANDVQSRGLLERIAGDRYDNVNVRRHATVQLERLAHAKSEMALAEILSDGDRRLRSAAQSALEKIFPKDPTRVRLHGLASPHDDINGPAAAFLAEHGDPETLLERLASSTGVRSPDLRRLLRRGLARRGACPSRPVIQLLESDDAGLRAEAAWLAGTCGDASLASAVMAAVVRSMDEWLKNHEPKLARAWLAAAWAADRLDADVTKPAATALTTTGVPADLRAEAIRHIHHRGAVLHAPLLQTSLNDPDGSVRAAAATALAGLDAARAAGSLDGSLDAGVSGMIVDAALARDAKVLAKTDTRRIVVPRLLETERIELLVDAAKQKGDDLPRLSAIAALGRAASDEARVALEALLDGDGEEDKIRAAAFRALKRVERAHERRERYTS